MTVTHACMHACMQRQPSLDELAVPSMSLYCVAMYQAMDQNPPFPDADIHVIAGVDTFLGAAVAVDGVCGA